MLNNSGSYGPNEGPPNIVTSINRTQSNASNMNHNFNDFGKFVHQAASSASGYYEAHNFHNFGQSPLNIPPLMHQFQAYQSTGHGSPYLSQNSQFSYENAMQNYFPAVSTTAQAEHHNNMLDFSQSLYTKPLSTEQIINQKEPYITKGYPLNIPQVTPRIFQRSPNITRSTSNDSKDTENNSTLSINKRELSTTGISQDISTNKETNSNSHKNLTPNSEILLENTSEDPLRNIHQNDIETPKNLSQKPAENISETSQTIQRTTYNIVKNNNSPRGSILDKCMSESKRKSLEKTVRLIESILINSNNSKPEVIENTVDPLAFSPIPGTIQTNNENGNQNYTESDDEALIKKLPSKRKTKPTRKSSSRKICTQSSKGSATEITNQLIKVEIEDVKIEPLSWADIDYGNPFHRDSNGILRSNAGHAKIIDMQNSIEEALATIKSGSSTIGLFECPHCFLLVQHPKRFLIHTKWHYFGLLNEKRAEMVKEREEKSKEKREARSIQRLSAHLATSDEDPQFPCKDCDNIFTTKTSLKNHRRKVHPPAPAPAQPECRICLAPARGPRELRAHLSSHEAAGLHHCPRCPKRFKYRHSLAKHVDTHREKTHACPSCDKLFGSLALVRLHLKVHERAARGAGHRCAYCGKGFYEAYNLQVHERTHRNDKPFKCDICESRFVTNSSLRRHAKVSHSGAKPYPCPVCQKCFSSASIRDRHELRAHSDQQQFPHQCQLCPRRYMKPKDLRNHTYKMHPKEKKKDLISDTEHNSS